VGVQRWFQLLNNVSVKVTNAVLSTPPPGGKILVKVTVKVKVTNSHSGINP
jgi:hypothetical protein